MKVDDETIDKIALLNHIVLKFDMMLEKEEEKGLPVIEPSDFVPNEELE
jgi:hypothetical protein